MPLATEKTLSRNPGKSGSFEGDSARVHRELSKALRVMHQALAVVDRMPINHLPSDSIRLAISQIHVARSFFEQGAGDE